MKREEKMLVIATFIGVDVETRGINQNGDPEYVFHYDELDDGMNPIHHTNYCNSITAEYDTNWQWLVPVWWKFIAIIWKNGKFDGVKYQRVYEDFNLRVARDAPREACDILVEALIEYEKTEKV